MRKQSEAGIFLNRGIGEFHLEGVLIEAGNGISILIIYPHDELEVIGYTTLTLPSYGKLAIRGIESGIGIRIGAGALLISTDR